MTDKYKQLRDALAAGTLSLNHVAVAEPEGLRWMTGRKMPEGVSSIELHSIPGGSCAHGCVAVNPESICVLLAERDVLQAALAELVECQKIKQRIAVEQATMIPETDDELRELDRLMTDLAKRQPKAWEAADFALAQHQGERHGDSTDTP